MAIAFDNGVHVNAATGSSLTYSFTCTGSNLILIVGVSDGDSNSDTITGVTYNGVAMTRFPNGYVGDSTNSNSAYGYYLLNPATGAHDVVISCSASHSLRSAAASYTGVNQSLTYSGGGATDASIAQLDTATTDVAVSLASISDNSWHVIYSQGGDALSAGLNTTARGSGTGSAHQIGDSNSAKTPAGSVTLHWTQATSQRAVSVMATISPVVITSSIKTINGLAIASVKTVNGLAVASMKTFNGLA